MISQFAGGTYLTFSPPPALSRLELLRGIHRRSGGLRAGAAPGPRHEHQGAPPEQVPAEAPARPPVGTVQGRHDESAARDQEDPKTAKHDATDAAGMRREEIFDACLTYFGHIFEFLAMTVVLFCFFAKFFVN